jgi:hypothetical protein
MLNRTNRTLSANLNRLNLGTRSLALVVGFNKGAQTLHTRHAAPVAMRAGIVGGYPAEPQPMGRIGIPSIPGSPSVSSWLIASPAIHPRVDSAFDAPSSADWLVGSFDPPCRRVEVPASDPTRLRQERGKPGRQPIGGRRGKQGARLAGMCRPATLGPVAAGSAAAGG